MPSHLIFLTVFLGLVSGKQGVTMQAGADIKAVRLILAGEELAYLTRAPWHADVDFGSELLPRELVAIGFDAKGNEIARASQVLNLPRPIADVQIVRDGNGLVLRYNHLQFSEPKKATVTFDKTKLNVDSSFRARFPKNADFSRPHVMQADMRFDDGVIARREVVLEGTRFSDTTGAELTPVAVIETAKTHPATLDGCFAIDGQAVRASVVEKPLARVIFVQDPDPAEAVRALDPAGRAKRMATQAQIALWAQLDEDTLQEVLWPVTTEFNDPSRQAVSRLFDHSPDFLPKIGLIDLLTVRYPPGYELRRLYVDAVAVAGVLSVGGRRRAVVYVHNTRPDASRAEVPAARKYLAALGVPLFVWSPVEVTTDATAHWGAIDDISTVDNLRAAAARLRAKLAPQRIAWIRADPLRALRVKANERCGYAMVADQERTPIAAAVFP